MYVRMESSLATVPLVRANMVTTMVVHLEDVWLVDLNESLHQAKVDVWPAVTGCRQQMAPPVFVDHWAQRTMMGPVAAHLALGRLIRQRAASLCANAPHPARYTTSTPGRVTPASTGRSSTVFATASPAPASTPLARLATTVPPIRVRCGKSDLYHHDLTQYIAVQMGGNTCIPCGAGISNQGSARCNCAQGASYNGNGSCACRQGYQYSSGDNSCKLEASIRARNKKRAGKARPVGRRFS